MRVIWFSHRDIRNPLAGGAERTIYEVGRRLAARGHEVHQVAVETGGLPENEVIDGIIVHRIKGNLFIHLLVHSMIQRVNPEVIIDDLAHVMPWLSPYFTTKKVVVFFRHLHARTLPGQVGLLNATLLTTIEKTYPLIYRNEAFVTETENGKSDLISLGISNDRISIIPPGVDTNLFRPAEKTKYPSLVYFGGLKKYKRPELSIEVMKHLCDIPDIQLTIIGDGHMRKELERLTVSCGLQDKVKFAGRLSQKDLANEVASAWLNLHFSVAEGFGYSVLEAAAAGTPTIAFDTPGVGEVIKRYKLGILSRNLEEMVSVIYDIVNSYPLHQRMFCHAVLPSWDGCVLQWERILTEE